MAKRAVKKAARADDKRGETAKNPRTVKAPEAKAKAAPPVKEFKRKTPGGGAGRPKKVK
jgi:hypothetical protein